MRIYLCCLVTLMPQKGIVKKLTQKKFRVFFSGARCSTCCLDFGLLSYIADKVYDPSGISIFIVIPGKNLNKVTEDFCLIRVKYH